MSSNHSPERSRHVCLAISTLARAGGAERVVALLANEWARRGTRVTILTTDRTDAKPFFELARDVELRNLGTARVSRGIWSAVVRNLREIATIRRAVRQVAPDVVISFIDTLNVTVIFACVGTGVPVIAAERTAPAHAPIGRIWTLLRNIAYRMADRVVVQSRGAFDFFRRALGSRLVIIPNPVPPAQSDAARNGGSRIVAIGRFTSEKGFDFLIRSFAAIVPQRPGWTLTIYGDGPLRPQLESVVAAEGLSGRVFLPGITTDASKALADADLFVLSSHYEGFPNVLCEAMAAGVASIATDCPDGPREIVHDGVDGILVAPGDRDALAGALLRLIDSPAERARLGGNARNAVGRFSFESVMADWAAVIGSVVR